MTWFSLFLDYKLISKKKKRLIVKLWCYRLTMLDLFCLLAPISPVFVYLTTIELHFLIQSMQGVFLGLWVVFCHLIFIDSDNFIFDSATTVPSLSMGHLAPEGYKDYSIKHFSETLSWTWSTSQCSYSIHENSAQTLVWSLGCEDVLEEEMAIHSSILAWKISWIEDPGRLQSMGSQRVGHNWVHMQALSHI